MDDSKTQLVQAVSTTIRTLHRDISQAYREIGGFPATLVLLREGKEVEPVNFDSYTTDAELTQAMIKAYSLEDGVDGTIFISEAWLKQVAYDSKEGRELKEHYKDDSWVQNNVSKLKGAQGAMEVLIFLVEVKQEKMMAYARLRRSGTSKTLGPVHIAHNEVNSLHGSPIGGIFREVSRETDDDEDNDS